MSELFKKTHKCKLIPNWTRKIVRLLINNINMKKFAWRKCWKTFLEAIFSQLRKFFSKFLPKLFLIILHNIIGFENFLLSFSQSKSRITMCNLHWCYTFCTGVTVLNCTALDQTESSNFFRYITNKLTPINDWKLCATNAYHS